MEIVIYGCGAIGSVLATLIKTSPKSDQHTVHLVGRRRLMDLVSRKGLIYQSYKSDIEIKTSGYKTYTKITDIQNADIVFFTMKAHGLEEALKNSKIWFKRKKPRIVLAMNGLGLKEIVKKYIKDNQIMEMSVGYPSKLERNIVKNTGGNSFFTVPKDNLSIKTYCEIFGYTKEQIDLWIATNAKQPIRFSEDFQQAKWKKGIANIGMNGISAISMLSVGEVLERKTFKYIIRRLIRETMYITDKLGIKFDEDPINWFFSFAGKDPDHKTSAFQDVLRENKTEIRFLNGFIVRKGKELGIDTPANLAVLNLMDIVEDGFGYKI